MHLIFNVCGGGENINHLNPQYIKDTESGVLIHEFTITQTNKDKQTNIFDFPITKTSIPYIIRFDFNSAKFSDEGKISAELNGEAILINERTGEFSTPTDITVYLNDQNRLEVKSKGFKRGTISIKIYCLLSTSILTRTFTKEKKEKSQTVDFSATPGKYVVRVKTSSNKKEKESSVKVTLNNKTLFSEEDFNNKNVILNKEVNLKDNNRLSVKIEGKPDNQLLLEIFPVVLEPPQITLTSPSDNIWTNQPSIRIEGNISSIQEKFVYINDLPATIEGDYYYLDVQLTEGTNNFEIKVADCCGFTSAPISLSVNADYTAPVPGIISAFDVYTNNPNPVFQVTSNEQESIFWCWRDFIDFTYCDNGVAFSNLDEGNHTVEVIAVDRAGNQSDFLPYYFVTDYTKPIVNNINGGERFGTVPYAPNIDKFN
mgnify:CR=1 FL=1